MVKLKSTSLNTSLRAIVAGLSAVLLLGGCAQGLGGGAYSRTEARRAMTVQFGTIESVRGVQLEGTKTPIGSVAGAAVGGIAGSTLGGGRGSAVAAVLGAVAGGVSLLPCRPRRCSPQHCIPSLRLHSSNNFHIRTRTYLRVIPRP